MWTWGRGLLYDHEMDVCFAPKKVFSFFFFAREFSSFFFLFSLSFLLPQPYNFHFFFRFMSISNRIHHHLIWGNGGFFKSSMHYRYIFRVVANLFRAFSVTEKVDVSRFFHTHFNRVWRKCWNPLKTVPAGGQIMNYFGVLGGIFTRNSFL